MYVCMYVCVCLSAHAILAVRAIKNTFVLSSKFAAILTMAFFFKLFYSKVRAFFTYLGWGGHLLVDAYSACNVSYTLRYMFFLRVKHCV